MGLWPSTSPDITKSAPVRSISFLAASNIMERQSTHGLKPAPLPYLGCLSISMYSSPRYTVLRSTFSWSALSRISKPHPRPQSKSQKGVLMATAETSKPFSCIILTASWLSRPPDSRATTFRFSGMAYGAHIRYYNATASGAAQNGVPPARDKL